MVCPYASCIDCCIGHSNGTVLVLILSVVVTVVVACCVALVTFARNWSKGFEDDGGTKMVINGTFSTEYYVTCWTEVEWPPVQCVDAPFVFKVDSVVTHNINASVCNALSIRCQCKCNYSYTVIAFRLGL